MHSLTSDKEFDIYGDTCMIPAPTIRVYSFRVPALLCVSCADIAGIITVIPIHGLMGGAGT